MCIEKSELTPYRRRDTVWTEPDVQIRIRRFLVSCSLCGSRIALALERLGRRQRPTTPSFSMVGQ